MKWTDLESDPCPIARALSVVGDRWTLLILRDCFLGRSRFEEFHSSLGLTRHVLTERLNRLVEGGVLERVEYARRRYDYVLTPRGRDLAPVMTDLFRWGKAHKRVRRPGGPLHPSASSG